MSDLQIQDLQIKQTFLERHIEEQDRVIYAMQSELEKIRKEIESLKQRAESTSDGSDMPANEKPPHY
ncbi:SlyX family protein [Pelagicoccus sp. SDUM812002]|uniref:SlyX family protein n=1 Tax=Pelagicoccus sp. SDUM812002 TaxID=3041266 RepID=UPI00280C4CAF|nr:SlyX family protein [Pelagicoccus sp. SDUM812002]MDQ8185925.1 SlyX family protein [Pelagicoccus sp. SDUM812002]